jgi:hypothetical protein
LQKHQTKPGTDPGFVLLVAPSGSYRVAAYCAAARALGMPILVISNSEHSLVAEIANGITVDFDQPEHAYATIIASIKNTAIACVLATDDSCVELCSRVAEYLGLPQNRAGAALLTQRKDLGREALEKSGCNTPGYQVVAIDECSGVIRADNDAEYTAAVKRIDAILEATGQRGFVREHLLVESYIDGEEYAIEGFVIDGRFMLLTIFDKPEPLTGPYFEETYYLTPTRLNARQQDELVREVANCCAAYGLEHGPVHAEARLSVSGPILLELAARTIGGQCGQLIEFSLQQKLEELVIQGMCGLVPHADEAAESAGVLMIPITDAGILKRVEGLTAALQTEFIRDIEIHINPGYELIPLPEGASYLGFIFAQAPEFEQTHAALKNAYAKLRFITQPKWELESSTA